MPLVCAKCKTSFTPHSEEFKRKFARGHVPLCGDCFRAVYGGLPVPKGKEAYVENRIETGVPHKGVKKHRCEDCGHEGFEHWIQRNRAAGIKCPGCGSRRYNLVTQEAKDDVAGLRAFKKNIPDGGSGHFAT